MIPGRATEGELGGILLERIADSNWKVLQELFTLAFG